MKVKIKILSLTVLIQKAEEYHPTGLVKPYIHRINSYRHYKLFLAIKRSIISESGPVLPVLLACVESVSITS